MTRPGCGARLLVAIGFAHRAGVIHAAVVPDHVLIHPAEHGLVLIDWCYAITEPDEPVAAVPARYADWYPPEVRRRQPPGQDLDLWLAARCLTDLMGDQAPLLAGCLRPGCLLPSPQARPRDAWRLLSRIGRGAGTPVRAAQVPPLRDAHVRVKES